MRERILAQRNGAGAAAEADFEQPPRSVSFDALMEEETRTEGLLSREEVDALMGAAQASAQPARSVIEAEYNFVPAQPAAPAAAAAPAASAAPEHTSAPRGGRLYTEDELEAKIQAEVAERVARLLTLDAKMRLGEQQSTEQFAPPPQPLVSAEPAAEVPAPPPEQPTTPPAQPSPEPPKAPEPEPPAQPVQAEPPAQPASPQAPQAQPTPPENPAPPKEQPPKRRLVETPVISPAGYTPIPVGSNPGNGVGYGLVQVKVLYDHGKIVKILTAEELADLARKAKNRHK